MHGRGLGKRGRNWRNCTRQRERGGGGGLQLCSQITCHNPSHLSRIRGNTVEIPVSSKWTKEDCERIIIHLLLEEYLQEDYGFTAYQTTVYLVPGPRCRLLLNSVINVLKLEFDPPSTKEMIKKKDMSLKRAAGSSSSSSLSSSTSGATSKITKKPKVFVRPASYNDDDDPFEVFDDGKGDDDDVVMIAGGSKGNHVKESSEEPILVED